MPDLRNSPVSILADHLRLAQELIEKARATIDVIMPGYTHMQPARATTFAQWCAAYSDVLLRDVGRLRSAYGRHNTSPLEAAESYGTSWPVTTIEQ